MLVRPVVTLIGVIVLASPASGEELWTDSPSSVLGQNYGFARGAAAETPIGEVDFVFESAVFAKNLEYQSDLARDGFEGETFFGFLAPLRLRYRADEDLTVEVGAVLGQNFGDHDTLDVAEPLLRLAYEFDDGVSLIAGTILPTHWSHQALLDDVQRLRTNAEQGFQVRVDREAVSHDSWINWRVRENGVEPEEFEIGSTTRVRPWGPAVELDGHLHWGHIGGQVNTSGVVENDIAVMLGASQGWFGVGGSEEIRVGLRGIKAWQDASGEAPSDGGGFEAFGRVDVAAGERGRVRVFGSYFAGDGLPLARGEPLYTFDRYAQLGVLARYELGEGLGLECGLAGQHAGGTDQFSFFVTLTWGDVFGIDGVWARR